MYLKFGEITMSAGARVTLAIACTLIAAAFAVLATFYGDVFEVGRPLLYGLAAFCALIPLACLVPQTRPVTVRLIRGAVFAVCACYVYSSYMDGGMPKALMCFIVFGLPAGYAAVMGSYPRWGKGAEAFRGSSRREEVQE
jgi:hypothetical protein